MLVDFLFDLLWFKTSFGIFSSSAICQFHIAFALLLLLLLLILLLSRALFSHYLFQKFVARSISSSQPLLHSLCGAFCFDLSHITAKSLHD